MRENDSAVFDTLICRQVSYLKAGGERLARRFGGGYKVDINPSR